MLKSLNKNKNIIISALLAVALLLVLVIIWRTEAESGTSSQARAWLTTADQSHLLTEQTPLVFGTGGESGGLSVDVNPHLRYQTMDGFGAAVTGSSAYLINEKLSGKQREQLLKELFTDSGIGMSFVRHTIGASDYSVDAGGQPVSYTYDDIESGTDYELEHFSVEKDREVITLLGDILQLNRELKVMGTPWSAPGWMKFGENKTMNGGYLDYNDSGIYEAYANYFVKYLQAYKEAGVPVYAVTVQNEPGFATADYPSMNMGEAEQARFIREYLGPALEKSGLQTKLLGFDHNWDKGADYARALLSDSGTNKYTAGTAYHCYAGEPEAMSEVHDAYPDKGIYFTECSGGGWSGDFGDSLSWNMSKLIIQSPRNWAKSVLFWNLALDPEGGPENGGCGDCRGVVTVDPQTGEISRNVEYYALGHAGKFVRPGAVRIDSTQVEGQLETVAYENPDGSTALIAASPGEEAVSFTVRYRSESFHYTLPAKSAVTFTWQG
ncbi:glycoside hydrolase family 30 protein [Paenibacillus donghaensis]|uniref:Beta-1,6-glucanase n=1 Tax=Paenibacillus donghaensis TaxID=414771 RepID=A0A2Z2KDH1_9BACL|nr:glycoside hydrolase family 30 beta sandwich domain-containing protein [Paenibacillus donghaensis]ASA23717.1 beta-1,6-glucanase [Paenibacillus donghaensis]